MILKMGPKVSRGAGRALLAPCRSENEGGHRPLKSSLMINTSFIFVKNSVNREVRRRFKINATNHFI